MLMLRAKSGHYNANSSDTKTAVRENAASHFHAIVNVFLVECCPYLQCNKYL